MKRIHVFFAGRVQGVGFRYTAQHIGDRLGITGWVRNLRDGRVEVVGEAEEKDLKTFLENMKDEFSGQYVTDVHITWEKPTDEFNGFDIVFD